MGDGVGEGTGGDRGGGIARVEVCFTGDCDCKDGECGL